MTKTGTNKPYTEEEFIIDGMSCAACSAAVERVTRKLEGVSESDVNLTTNKMRIVFDAEKVSDELIIEKVQKAGFGCRKAETAQKTKFTERGTTQKNVQTAVHRRESGAISAIHLSTSWIFAALLMYAAMGHMIGLPLPAIFSPQNYPSNFALLNLLLAVPILFLGKDFYLRGLKSLLHFNPNMDTLVALGSVSAFIYSLAITFSIPLKPYLVHDLYYEASAVVLVFIMTGKYLEGKSKEKTKSAVSALMSLTPDNAVFVENFGAADEKLRDVATSELKAGDTVLVKAGQRIPLDGTVLKGTSGVDESMLTGESLPVEKHGGSSVTGGSINGSGALYVQITRIGEDTTLSKIIRFVEEAQGKKAPISKVADKVSGIFVPAVILIALCSAIGWILAGADAAFILRVSTSVLVIACPCALGLATPAAVMTGTGLAAANGILISSGEALETAKQVDTIVLDKTGTVTEGKPILSAVFTAQGQDTDSLLALAAAVETASAHPLAKALTDAAALKKTTNAFTILSFENVSGKGIRAQTVCSAKNFGGTKKQAKKTNEAAKTEVLVGSRRFMEENGIDCSAFTAEARNAAASGAALVYLAAGGTFLGLITVTDAVKEHSIEAVRLMKKQGLYVILLTGDNKAAAGFIGSRIGADEVIAEVLPEDKARVIEELQNKGKTVMMIGDGINDAPALVQADVGVAMGGGSDIAVESGDIVLVKGDLRDAVKAVKLSKMTIRNIKQNLFWAFFYNSIGIPVAAGLLYPAFGLLLSPMIGSFAMSLSSVFVVTNALRLRKKKL